MARTALVLNRTKIITHPEEDANDPAATKYHIQALSPRAMAYIRDQAVDVQIHMNPETKMMEPVAVPRTGLSILLTAHLGLRDIENLLDPASETNEAIKFKAHVIHNCGGAKWVCVEPDAMNRIDSDDHVWLATEIQKFTAATEADVGKSNEQS